MGRMKEKYQMLHNILELISWPFKRPIIHQSTNKVHFGSLFNEVIYIGELVKLEHKRNFYDHHVVLILAVESSGRES
jgi:hypothetical protein